MEKRKNKRRSLEDCDSDIGEEGCIQRVHYNECKMSTFKEFPKKTIFCFNCNSKVKNCIANNNPCCPRCDNGCVEFVKTEDSEASQDEENEKSYEDYENDSDHDSVFDSDNDHSSDQQNNYSTNQPVDNWSRFLSNNENTHFYHEGSNFAIFRIQRGPGIPSNFINSSGIFRRRRSPIDQQESSINPFRRAPSSLFDDNLFERIEMLINRLQLHGTNDQVPANEETLDKLKPKKLNKKYYEVDQKTGKKVPPSCTICTDEMTDDVIKLKCKHFFHNECIKKWLGIHHCCPICRKEVD